MLCEHNTCHIVVSSVYDRVELYNMPLSKYNKNFIRRGYDDGGRTESMGHFSANVSPDVPNV